MPPVQLENDPSIITREADDTPNNEWIVRVGQDIVIFSGWHSAFDHFLDEIKAWLGYYQAQIEDSKERGLTWTAETYTTYVEDYVRWIEYLQSIEDSPRGINLIGSNRQLSISSRNKQ